MSRYEFREFDRTEAAEEALREALDASSSSSFDARSVSLQALQSYNARILSASVSQETDLARAKILGASDAGIIPTQVLKERRHARSHLEVEHLTKLNARLKEDLEEERAKGMSLRKEIGLLKEEIVRLNAGKRDHLRARAVAVHELGEEKRARVGLGDAKRALEEKHALAAEACASWKRKYDSLAARVRAREEAEAERRAKKWTLGRMIRLLKKRL